MSSYDYVVLLLIILVLVYLGLNYKVIKPVDIILIIIAVIVLVYISFFKGGNLSEHFSASATANTKIQIEEDTSDVNKTCVLYNTTFNSGSYIPDNGTVWNSVINPSGSVKKLTFDLNPIYAPENGFYLGNNRIVGPYSNDLGIDFLSTYTIMIACKHGNLVTNVNSSGNDEIELMKLYANSPNNNGIALYIQANSLSSENNVQVGSLMLQYTDSEPVPCLIDQNHKYINFDRDVLTFYFIIKDTDNFRIQMMTDTSSTISQILKFNISNQDINLSNREFILNRLKNWNANIYNIALFSSALSDDDVTKTYNHILNEYMKRIDPNFTSVIGTYNNTVDMVEELTKCPFGDSVCKNCQSVNKWYDVNDVVNSNEQCKKSINEFCTSNPKHHWCKCWDSSLGMYNSVNCQLFRSIFAGKESLLETLSDADLGLIMSQYNLITNEDCKKNTDSAVQQTWKQTKNIGETMPDRVKIVLPHDEDQPIKDSNGNIINYYAEGDPSLNPKLIAKQDAQKNFSVNNMMYADVNTNFDPTQTIAFKEYQNIKNVLEQQQASGKVVNPPPQQPESYFDKFLRVVMPGS
jgi:hypothetical protein